MSEKIIKELEDAVFKEGSKAETAIESPNETLVEPTVESPAEPLVESTIKNKKPKKKKRKAFALFVIFAVLCAPAAFYFKSIEKNETRISARSLDDFKKTSGIMALEIKNPEKQKEFVNAATIIENSETPLAIIEGYNADEVIRHASMIEKEKEDQKNINNLESAKRDQIEMNDLYEARAKAEASYNQLAGLVLEDSRLQKIENPDGSISNVVEIRAHNKTPYALSEVVFDSKISSPGRSIPWIEQTLTHAIPGGIEPGEYATLNVDIPNFADWLKIQFPADANFSIQVSELRGVGKKRVLPTVFFTEDQKDRLQELLAKYHLTDRDQVKEEGAVSDQNIEDLKKEPTIENPKDDMKMEDLPDLNAQAAQTEELPIPEDVPTPEKKPEEANPESGKSDRITPSENEEKEPVETPGFTRPVED